MATTGKVTGSKSKLYYSTNDGGSWTAIDYLQKTGPLGSAPTPDVEATDLDSTAEEYIPGLAVNGEFTFSRYHTKTRHAALLALKDVAGVKWKLTDPDNSNPDLASNHQFYGILKQVTAPAREKNVPLVTECVVTVTGAITFTQGS